MRQVFTSPRLETVEAVAELLRTQGIKIKISNDRSYRGNRRSWFSYRKGEPAGPQPAVWIVNAEDQPRGRQLLREAGLLESTREGASSYLPASALDEGRTSGKRGLSIHYRVFLFGAIAVVIALVWFAAREPAPTPAAASVAAAPATPIAIEQVELGERYRVDVPTALARRLIEGELAARKPATACLRVDGKPASPLVLQGLQANGTGLADAEACPADALRIEVRDYLTDGSGVGQVQVDAGPDVGRVHDVERDGERWTISRQP